MVLINHSGHLMRKLEGRSGARKGSSLSSTHIPAIRLQHIKAGKEGAYYTTFKKRQYSY